MEQDINSFPTEYLISRAIDAQDFIAGLTWGAS